MAGVFLPVIRIEVSRCSASRGPQNIIFIMNEEYKDADVLEEEYWIKNKTLSEIGDTFGVSGSTISYWMGKLGVPVVSQSDNQVYHDEDLLRKLYHEEGLSTYKIADRARVADTTILSWMERHGVERRPANSEKTANFYEDSQGYHRMNVNLEDGGKYTLYLHRLNAIAEHGLGEVLGMDVHHDNKFKLDNRPVNLEVLTKEEHAKRHS